jgi:hypothetical protein
LPSCSGSHGRLGLNIGRNISRTKTCRAWSPLKRVDHVPWKRMDHLPRSAWINSREARGLPLWSVRMASLGSAWMTSPEARGTPSSSAWITSLGSRGSTPSDRIGIRTRLGSNVESELDLLIKNRNVSCVVALEARGSRPLEAYRSPPSERVDHSREARG